jgi:succinyl-CoA synthetase beta subunit
MYLLEHDAKELLARHGVVVPEGWLIRRDETIHRRALPAGPWVVKGQVATGGRGKAGLIRKAATEREVSDCMGAMLGATIKGRSVEAVRIEQQVIGAEEAYIGLLLDAAAGGVRVIMSTRGGMDVESLPASAVRTDTAAAESAALSACIASLAATFDGAMGKALGQAGSRLAHALLGHEALLVEVNPLFVHPDGRWIAGDAKVIIDDNALPRQQALSKLVAARAADYPDVARKLEHGFDYVVVDPEGEIGLLTTGAGLSMMLIDELRAAALKPYNFLDIRTGGLRGETTRLTQVLEWIGQGKNVKVLLVNIFAGITDLGEFSRLLLQALRGASALRVPVVARLVGNGLLAAHATLAPAGIAPHTDLDLALAEVCKHLRTTGNG